MHVSTLQDAAMSTTSSPLLFILPSVEEELDPFSLDDAEYPPDAVDLNPFRSTPVKKQKIEDNSPKCCDENCHSQLSTA